MKGLTSALKPVLTYRKTIHPASHWILVAVLLRFAVIYLSKGLRIFSHARHLSCFFVSFSASRVIERTN